MTQNHSYKMSILELVQNGIFLHSTFYLDVLFRFGTGSILSTIRTKCFVWIFYICIIGLKNVFRNLCFDYLHHWLIVLAVNRYFHYLNNASELWLLLEIMLVHAKLMHALMG
jgi:hypothetical protein